MIRRLKEGGEDPLEAVRGLEGEVGSTELAELEHVLGMLAATGSDERRTVLESEHGPSVLSEEDVVALSRQASRAASPRLTLRAWATAAALLILALAAGRFGSGPSDRSDPALDPGPTLGNGLRALQPVGASSFERFEWEAQLLPGGWFEVLVYDAADPTRHVGRSPELEDPAWTPSTTETWPDAIVWEVVVYDGDGVPVDTARFEASRSRR